MGIYDITGWSGGGRRPINYGLKAGQFRGMGRVNVFPSSTTIVNNNIIGGGCYSNSYDCGCNGGGGSNKFMNWMLGIGLGSTLLGGILSMFGIGGGGKAEGAGGKEEVKPEVKQEETKEPSKLDQARKTLDSLGMTKDNGYTVSVDEDGKITYHYNKDGIDVEADNITDLIDKINKAKNKDNTPTQILNEVSDDVETPAATSQDIQTGSGGNKPNTAARTGTGSPAGWYRAVNDGQELKAEKAQLEAAQKSGKNGFTAVVWSDGSKVTYRQNGKTITDANQVPQDLRQQVIKEMVKLRKGGTAASSQSAPPPSGNTQHVLTNGQKVNLSGAQVGKNPKANASQRDTFYLQTSDGQKINISRMDYYNIQKKIES